jgi:glycosyltransferase involved in cell wall biosynthesis
MSDAESRSLTQKIRVGLDAHMVGEHETGNETYVLGLIAGLTKLGSLLSLTVYHGAKAISADGTVEQRRVSTSPWKRLGLELPWRSWRDRLDMLHTTYSAPPLSACPVVLTVHDISYTDHPEWFSARDLRVLNTSVPFSIKRAARVITVSELCRRQIFDRYGPPEEKVVAIHNAAGAAAQPVEAAEARQVLARLGVDPNRRFILTVGNLQPRKNLVRLIEAFRTLVSTGVDVDLVVVGPERYRAELVREAASRLGSRVHFTGYLSDHELAACYAQAAVFAFPSLFEGFGIPALEAMSHGTPVACARAGALPEVCGAAAQYFDPLDVRSMIEAIRRLLEDDVCRAELARAGLERSKKFSWEQTAQQTMKVYESVHAGRPRADDRRRE